MHPRPGLRSRRSTASSVAIVGALLLALAGCAPADDAEVMGAPAVVTFEVAGQGEYRIELITDEQVEHVKELLAGGEDGRIPVGTVVRDDDGGVNAPWTWHIDPETLEFADATIEVCDGLPEYVEDRTITSDTYCPWSAKVVALEPLKR